MEAARPAQTSAPRLSFGSGMGLVVANMIGVGVLISAGFLV